MLFDYQPRNKIPKCRVQLLSWNNVAKEFVEHVASLLDVPTPEKRTENDKYYIKSYEPVLLASVEVNQLTIVKGIRIRAVLPEWPQKTEMIQAARKGIKLEPKPVEVEWIFPLPVPILHQHLLLSSNFYMPAFKIMDLPVTYSEEKNAIVITSYKPLYIMPLDPVSKKKISVYSAQIGGSRSNKKNLLDLILVDNVESITLLETNEKQVFERLDLALHNAENSRCVIANEAVTFYINLALLFILLNVTTKQPLNLKLLREFVGCLYARCKGTKPNNYYPIRNTEKFVGWFSLCASSNYDYFLNLLQPITLYTDDTSVVLDPTALIDLIHEKYVATVPDQTLVREFISDLIELIGLDREEHIAKEIIAHDDELNYIDEHSQPEQIFAALFTIESKGRAKKQLNYSFESTTKLRTVFEHLIKDAKTYMADLPTMCDYLGVTGHICPSKSVLANMKQHAKLIKYIVKVSAKDQYGWNDLLDMLCDMIENTEELKKKIVKLEGYTNLKTKVVRLVYPALVQVINQAYRQVSSYMKTGKPSRKHISRISSLVSTDSIILVSESYSIRNPIAEVALAYRTTFPWSEDVRTSTMRELDPSALGIYDPLLTPESAKTGITNWIVCEPKPIQTTPVTLSELYKFEQDA